MVPRRAPRAARLGGPAHPPPGRVVLLHACGAAACSCCSLERVLRALLLRCSDALLPRISVCAAPDAVSVFRSARRLPAPPRLDSDGASSAEWGVTAVRGRRTKRFPHPVSASAEGLAAVFRLLARAPLPPDAQPS
jgi:hypothetical protein